MAGMQAHVVLPAAEGGRRPATMEPSRRYDPSMYNHLPSWETPLPFSDEEPEGDELPTFPLGSGSTQLLSQTVLAGGSASNKRGEYTTLLQQGLGDDNDGGVDLWFGLCSGAAREQSRTFIIDADRSPRGVQQSRSQHTERSTLRGGASVTSGVGPSAAGRQHGSSAPSADRLTSTCPARNGVAVESLRSGGARPSMPKSTTPTQLDLRDDGTCRPAVRPAPTVENITRGVSNMRAHSNGGDDDGGGGDDADERFREDVEAGDDDDDTPIRPLGKTGGRGRGRSRGAVRGRSIGRGDRGGVSDDGGKSATYWSPEMQLVRCKREQEMHLAGLGHNYGRMRTKEWKWDDIAQRMANAGKPKDAEDSMKKWDNIFQNYKKIQRFQNASGRPDFFRLSNEERKEHNFKFRMKRALYNEIHAGMVGNHTIFSPNIADTGSPDGVQLPRRGAGVGASVGSEGAGEGFPEERSTTRDSDNNAASEAGGGKRKNARQHELESISDVMDRHGELMSSTIESSSKRQCSIFTRQCDILDQEVAFQKAHYVASDETQRMMCHTLMKIIAAIRDTEKAPVVDLGSDDDEPLERRRIRIRTTATPPPAVMARAAANERPVLSRLLATPSQPHQRNEGGDGGSVQRGGWGEVVADARAVQAEEAGAAGAGGSGTVAALATAREEAAVVATAREEARGEKKGDREAGEPGSSRQAISRMAEVVNVALRILHGWVFKSGNRTRGYHVAFQYSLESFATDIARAMWYGEEWCDVVSPTVCVHTIDLSMDMPLWFADANIEDRPDNNDMAAHQESTVICVAHAFRAAVQMGALIDGEFISHDRLCRVDDCFRLLLVACMWIMRMARDDPRSHYEAFYFANFVAKPTLVAAMHRSLDHRRSVVRAAKVVTESLGKANATFGQYPDYIPQWAPCGIGFRHDASITGPEDAKKLDWLGSAPPDDDNNNEGKDGA
ncbi:hypothetical protein CBR_g39093 [Chara braunii]|uniref:Myb-like domain-containing protein n=1 Tax=Chara braunii TaxID=69332 RepID=A0A388LQX8_CHABU|nr:hypothetical protein CBR_g39093 [Chara braunii]|eukprot:GBG84717.1 hypothetical protein CBR_g39093 [Chara braunii]